MTCGQAVILVCAAGLAGGALAATPPNPKDLTQGVWEMQPAKSKFCNPAEAPKKSVRRVIDAGWGLISVHWTGTFADGKPIDYRYVYRYDGQKYPEDIDQSPASESISWKLVNPHRVEFTHWSRDDKITQQLVRTVSADGQTMTQTTKLSDRPGCTDVQVFERQ